MEVLAFFILSAIGLTAWQLWVLVASILAPVDAPKPIGGVIAASLFSLAQALVLLALLGWPPDFAGYFIWFLPVAASSVSLLTVFLKR